MGKGFTQPCCSRSCQGTFACKSLLISQPVCFSTACHGMQEGLALLDLQKIKGQHVLMALETYYLFIYLIQKSKLGGNE